MFCKSCGKEIPEGAKFCSGCGTPVEPAQGAPEDQKGTNTVENAAPVYEHAPESGGSGAAAVVAAAGAAVAGGVGALKHRGKSGLIVLGVAAVVVIAVIVLLVTVIKTLIFGNPVAGYPTIVSLILLVGGLLMFFIGMLGQYLAKTYMETKARPVYIVRETERGLK